MITRIKRPYDRSDEPKPKRADVNSDSRPTTRGCPKLLASIPKKEGESREDFVNRFLEKLANLPTKPNKD